jgi:hypothetical protein
MVFGMNDKIKILEDTIKNTIKFIDKLYDEDQNYDLISIKYMLVNGLKRSESECQNNGPS